MTNLTRTDPPPAGPQPPGATLAVDMQGVLKTFSTPEGKIAAVNDVSLSVKTGSIVALLGPNGAGKTTAIDLILGLNTPTSGKLTVLGQQPRQATRSGNVSAVLQSGGLLRDLRVEETVELIASTFPNPISVDEALERAGLIALRRRKVAKCSGGEQQRLRFALALLSDPDLLILDEPTTGMDVNARAEFWETMHREADQGRTIIFATHYLQEADNFADRVIMIAGGKVVADGTTEEIRARATGRLVSARIKQGIEKVRDELQARADVHSVQVNGGDGDRIVVHTSDSDAVALALLSEFGGYDLEATAGSLDDAFTALTTQKGEVA